jgi:hypothetical protein
MFKRLRINGTHEELLEAETILIDLHYTWIGSAYGKFYLHALKRYETKSIVTDSKGNIMWSQKTNGDEYITISLNQLKSMNTPLYKTLNGDNNEQKTTN